MGDKVKFKVIGNHRVNGVEPGKVVEFPANNVQIEALLIGGHISPLPPPKPPKDPKGKGGEKE